MICHLLFRCPKDWYSSVHSKSDFKHLHRPVEPFLYLYLTSSLYNGIFSFFTFCRPHWQVSRPSESLHKDFCHFEDLKESSEDMVSWCPFGRTHVLDHFVITGKKEFLLPLSLLLRCKFLNYNLTTKKSSSSSSSSSLISAGVAIEGNFLNNEVISSMDVHVSKKLFLPFLIVMASCRSHWGHWKT